MAVLNSAARPPRANRSQVLSLASIVVFDTAGPLVAYSLLHSGGASRVVALVLSGILPAFGVALNLSRHQRLDAIGTLVLAGILVSVAVAVASSNPKWLLLEDSVFTGVFGLVCLGSLWSRRPLMFRFALQGKGAETSAGRDFAELWHHSAGFRHVFRVITAVWGIAYLAEAAARVIIVESTSTGTAFTISKVMPYVVAGIVVAWMIPYSLRAKRRGERLRAAQR
ncbi:MAG: VC0807 family protein [Solirubrobacteraceae bacterium]